MTGLGPGDHRSESSSATSAEAVTQYLLDGEEIESTVALRLLDGALQPSFRGDGGKVDEGAGDGGHGEAVVDGYLVYRQ